MLKRLVLILVIVMIAACSSNNDDDKNDDAKDTKQYKVGILNLTPNLEDVVTGFQAQMTELGYTEGENITYVYDGPTKDVALLDSFATSLIEQDVDLIVAITTPAALAVLNQTTDIPVVFTPISDPVGSGLVTDLTQPGANATGISTAGTSAKRLEIMVTMFPNIEKIYIPYNSEDSAPLAEFNEVSVVADNLGIEIVDYVATTPEDLDGAIDGVPTENTQVIFLLGDGLISTRMDDFITKADELDIILSVSSASSVEDGAFMTYGPQLGPIGNQTARLTDQILKGTNAGDIPVENVELFLVANLATAENINVEISDEILSLVDVVIRSE